MGSFQRLRSDGAVHTTFRMEPLLATALSLLLSFNRSFVLCAKFSHWWHVPNQTAARIDIFIIHASIFPIDSQVLFGLKRAHCYSKHLAYLACLEVARLQSTSCILCPHVHVAPIFRLKAWMRASRSHRRREKTWKSLLDATEERADNGKEKWICD